MTKRLLAIAFCAAAIVASAPLLASGFIQDIPASAKPWAAVLEADAAALEARAIVQPYERP